MKRGFTQTLMMAAIVVMAAQALAMAPIVSDIPSPVVGDQETITPANTFVYPDAIDLSKYVTDTVTTVSTDIKWYYRVETAGEHFYSINNAPEVDDTDNLNDPNTIAAAKIIAGPGKTSSDPAGTDASKITIRNKHLTPIAGPNIAPDGDQTQIVTLYASDGETVTAQPVAFYTAAGELDHLSPSGIKDIDRAFTGATTGVTNGYTYLTGVGTLGHSISTLGICMTINTTDVDHSGSWNSPFSEIKLVKNAAYRVRMTINGTQTAENETPLWDVILTNLWIDPSIQPITAAAIHGKQAYGADFWMYDGIGGENAYVQFVAGGGNAIYDFWWTPAPVLTARWNDTSSTQGGLFASNAGVDDGDAQISFRIINSRASRGSDADIHADRSVGTLCLKALTVERFDMGNLTTDATPVWNCTSWTQASGTTPGGGWNVGQSNVTATSASDGITVKATSGSDASANCYAALAPGDNVRDLATPSVNTDNFPCPMDPKTLYKVTYSLAAPTQTDMDHPVDVFWLTNEMMSQEEIQESYVSSMAWHHGMPATGAAQQFYAFFYSNYGTNRSGGNLPTFWSSFHPKFAITNNSSFVGPGAETKVGGIKLSGVLVEKVTGGFTN